MSLQHLGVIAPFQQWKRRAPWPAASHQFEIACALSHMKACQVIAESDADFGFVFEDDNVISPSCISRFKDITKWAEKHTKDFLVLNISPCNSFHTSNGILPGSQGCTNALLYSKKGAQFVVENLLPLSIVHRCGCIWRARAHVHRKVNVHLLCFKSRYLQLMSVSAESFVPALL